MTFLAYVARARPTELRLDSFRLMNVTAEEVRRLMLPDEIADRGRPALQALADAIERRAVRRRVADQHQRIERRETFQALGKLRLGIFARSVEGRRARVAETGDIPAANLQVPLVQIVKSVTGAHAGHLVGGLVVAGKGVHLIAAGT